VSREQTLIECLINVTFYVRLKVTCNCTKKARFEKIIIDFVFTQPTHTCLFLYYIFSRERERESLRVGEQFE